MRTRPDRRRAEARGRRAEWLARWLLRLKGYRVLAVGYRVPVGEIDILVQRGGVVAAIEVKHRGAFAEAAEAIGQRQRRRIRRATEHFLSSRPALQDKAIRFDAVLVSSWGWPKHIPGAWTDE